MISDDKASSSQQGIAEDTILSAWNIKGRKPKYTSAVSKLQASDASSFIGGTTPKGVHTPISVCVNSFKVAYIIQRNTCKLAGSPLVSPLFFFILNDKGLLQF